MYSLLALGGMFYVIALLKREKPAKAQLSEVHETNRDKP